MKSGMKPPRSSVQALAKRLMESGDASYEVAELSQEECEELDSVVFECQGCNWWFHQRDNATKDEAEWLCRQCADHKI